MPLNTYVRIAGSWAPVGEVTAPPPPPPPPPPVGDITHGEQIPGPSGQALAVIGPTGALTEWTGGTTLSGTQTIEGRTFTDKTLTIAAGANITLRRCRIIGPLGQTSYTLRATAGGGLRLTLEDCEVIGRAGSTSVRCLVMWGDGNIAVRRTVMRGGIDNVYVNPDHSPGQFVTGDPLVPNARVLLEDSWFGDLERMPASHTDCVQIDGGGYTLIRRSRIMCYNIPPGSDTLTTAADGSSRGSGGLIATQNSSNPAQISHVALRDSWFEGGNYTVDVAPSDGLPVTDVAATGNRWGTNHQFGPLRLPSGSANSNNTWGQAGLTACCGMVDVGQLLAGSA